MCRPHREQAHSYKGSVLGIELGDAQNRLWEQSLLAMAVWQSTKMLNVPASSRASSAPTGGLCRTENWVMPKISCGSELARDGGVAVNKDVEWTGLIASKLGSHRGFVPGTELGDAQNLLWERACSRWLFNIQQIG
ncbi:hypothetical protein BI292_16460 [Pseudomonas sp. 43NM1]|nr:hypothetical protein BI292_16460 [Pseudomonas sp. 43NM1]